MNATEKAKVLRKNGYQYTYSMKSDGVFYRWFAPDGTELKSTRKYIATNLAYNHLEAQVTQAANDLAGQEAYVEVKAGSAPQITQQEYDEALIQVLQDETAQLRQQVGIASSELQSEISKNQELRAENEALKAENSDLETENEKRHLHIAQIEAENGRYRGTLEHVVSYLVNVVNQDKTGDIQDALDAISSALDPAKLALQPAPIAQAEASEVVAKPKKAIPARMRVNWNKRGFSSGSYEVLGYSQEKQCYMLNISTDETRPMLKAVKMADCLAVQA